MKKEERIILFVDAIWSWYARHKRQLPWRDLPDNDPNIRAYKILVSEVMLQQTQVPRVIIVFKRFLEQFPTMQALASASNKEVILAWRGMGYNSRALRLRDAARHILAKSEIRKPKFEGNSNLENSIISKLPSDLEFRSSVFPREMDMLLSIPGVGHYTAAAVMNFAFGIPTPCIDTNIRRILHRTFVGPETGDGKWKVQDKELLEIAGDVLNEALRQKKTSSVPSGSSVPSVPSEWHAALMDFGSLVQTKRNPKWDVCPLSINRIMVTTSKSWNRAQKLITYSGSVKLEPGRAIAGKHVPNRIIRGRVVELLRDAAKPLTLESIGREVCIDWSADAHREWLDGIVTKLTKDAIVSREKRGYVLKN